MLTIKQFSRLTAIPESTLRYYEQEGILAPAARTPAGYRQYTAEQILPAKFLYSLRLAEVPLDQVRSYQTASDTERKATLANWQQELTQRINRLQVARLYVETLMGQGSGTEPVHLQVTEREQVIWFVREAPTGHFGPIFDACYCTLKEAGIATGEQTYFRWLCDLDDRPGWVRGQVGFQLTGKLPATLPEGAHAEELPPALTLSLEHKGPFDQIDKTHMRLIAFMQAHGWEPAGPDYERYPQADDCYTEILRPILYL
jgi:DNA-binding transcriptional MerR regulator